MVKKILSVILSVTLLCSMAVVAGANTTEKTEWAENFDSYTADDFYVSEDTTSSLWVTADCKEHEAYASGEGGHYHLNDGWTMQSRGFLSGSYAAYNAWSLKDGDHGKKNGDKSLYADTVDYHHVNLKNNFGGTSVDLTNGNAIGFSFDWYDGSTQIKTGHSNLKREIKMTVTLGNTNTSVEEVKDEELLLGSIMWNGFDGSAGSNDSNSAAFEAWNDFLIYVSKDAVKARSSSITSQICNFDIANYDPTTRTWTTGANTGYYIKSVKSVEVHLRGIASPIRQNGIDNLKVWISDDGIPETLPKKEMPNFLNFTAVQTTVTAQGGGDTFRLVGGEAANSRIGVQLAGTNSEKIIKPSLVIDNNDTVKSAAGTDSWLKITCDSAGGTGEYLFYVIFFDKTGAAVGKAGDIIQTSCNIKLKGDSAAKSTHSAWDISANFSTGSAKIVSIAGDGTVFDPADSSRPLAKLNADTWYSVDAVFSLTNGATNATVYIDGVPVLEKSVTGAWTNIGAVRLCYNPELNGEGTGYLANTVYLDNLCYRIFEGGEGAYDFDKSLTRANNKVMTAATENFATGVIAPVAEDWTVGEFNALGLTNASVVAIADDTETVVSDSAALLKDYTIKITGDYGKTMYYTVSSDGATLVTKDYLVIAKQNGTVLLDEGVCKAGSGISAVAYDKAGTANIIFTAEYDSDNKLVNVVEGAAYAPAAAGNTIKLFVWTDKGTIVPVAPETTLRVAE